MDINFPPKDSYRFITNFPTKQLPIYELSASIYNRLMKSNIVIISNSCNDIIDISLASMFCITSHNNLSGFWEIFNDLKSVSIKYINEY